ncbi:nitrilotriacetate monooxygenase subunit B [Thioclava atlantica]|uniref:Nitrilotriacetate monooxygenase subunit B n=2 Tax=Thioclava atlantica TaxID=1317124 RepID=A0A085TWV7_9RHOB|nr:nitrilotriacetate monooxygenase subunit B [Thioclava atlantica]
MRESDDIEAAMDRAEASGRGHVPDPAEPRLLRDALGRFATGVTVVTACECGGEGNPIGITVNSFASVSLSPALILWSAARSSMRHAHYTEAPAFAVHVLRHDQSGLARRFTRSGDRFDGLDYTMNEDGVPLLADTLARFECVTEARHDGGDHTIIIGRVTRFTADPDGTPLIFSGGQFGGFVPDAQPS